MRERRTGAIVNITSIAGLIATPNQLAYSASKWALECLGEALAHEVFRFGIRVVNVEPGVIMTRIFEEFGQRHPLRQDLAVPADHAAERQIVRRGIQSARSPSVAETILEAITTPDYRLRWPVGEDASACRRPPEISDEEWVAHGRRSLRPGIQPALQRFFGIRLSKRQRPNATHAIASAVTSATTRATIMSCVPPTGRPPRGRAPTKETSAITTTAIASIPSQVTWACPLERVCRRARS